MIIGICIIILCIILCIKTNKQTGGSESKSTFYAIIDESSAQQPIRLKGPEIRRFEDDTDLRGMINLRDIHVETPIIHDWKRNADGSVTVQGAQLYCPTTQSRKKLPLRGPFKTPVTNLPIDMWSDIQTTHTVN